MSSVNVRQRLALIDLVKMALVASLYVAVTFVFAPISFGVIQFRLAEMFNYLPLFNKRYIYAVPLGVAIANMASPLGIVDVVIGSVSTLLVLLLVRYLTKKQTSLIRKMVVTAIVVSLSMFTVAAQLTYFYHLPFFMTWLTVALGELLSMTVGGTIMFWLSRKIDFTK